MQLQVCIKSQTAFAPRLDIVKASPYPHRRAQPLLNPPDRKKSKANKSVGVL